MGLRLHSAACEAYLTEPDDEYDDPLERVEFPRERKPWKRDRHELARTVRLHARDRTGWVICDRGWEHNLDPSQRFAELNAAWYYRYNLRIGHLSDYRRADLIRGWRYCVALARMRGKPRLP